MASCAPILGPLVPGATAFEAKACALQDREAASPKRWILQRQRSLAPAQARHRVSGKSAADASIAPARTPARVAVPSMRDQPFDRKVYRSRPTTRRLRTGPYLRHADGELVKMALQGDLDAYDELVERYQNGARNRALSVVQDYQAAEDIAQDALVKAFNALKDLEDPQRFAGWLLTIVQHTALDFVRARREGMSLETLKEQGFEAPRDTRGLQLEKMEEREEDLKVLEAMGELRDDYREILILKHVEGLSYREIAERLEMTVSAVGEKLSRVRGLLKRRLEKKRVQRGTAGDPAQDQAEAEDE